MHHIPYVSMTPRVLELKSSSNDRRVAISKSVCR